MKKVGLVTTRFIRQGPNRQLLYLVRYLNRNNIHPVIITLSKERDPSLFSDFLKENVRIIQLELGLFDSLFRSRKILQDIVDTEGIEIMHSFTYATRVEFAICTLNRVLKIATVRNAPREGSFGYNGKILGLFFYFLKRSFYKKFNKIVACSNSIFQLKELAEFDRVLIKNGIDSLNLPQVNDLSCSIIKKKLGIVAGKTIYITIANGTPIKNIEFLVEVFRRKPEKILIIAGNLNSSGIHQKDCQNYANILYTGHVNNIFDLYSIADIFISASYLEGLPNAVLESLLLGTPCLLSNIPMHREVLENSDENIGYLFTNNDFDDVTDKMDKIEKMINFNTEVYCKKHILKNFTAKSMAEEYEKLYLSL